MPRQILSELLTKQIEEHKAKKHKILIKFNTNFLREKVVNKLVKKII